MAEHTAGPWHVAPRKATYQVIGEAAKKLVRVGLPTEFRALSVGAEGGQVAIIPLDESKEANADLIAAAPDLLAVCEMVLEDGFLESDKLTWATEIIGELEDTIAKARGEERNHAIDNA